ncbi:MAG TPA: hypothetical protein VN903_17225 [Polyangia bacterium]|nr:hypothetical protein [Polyangia bacterium]
MKSETTTLENARLVNAVVSAAALCISGTDAKGIVLDANGVRYARVHAVLDDVCAALNVDRTLAMLAMDSAIAQGLLDVPEANVLIAVRPATL